MVVSAMRRVCDSLPSALLGTVVVLLAGCRPREPQGCAAIAALSSSAPITLVRVFPSIDIEAGVVLTQRPNSNDANDTRWWLATQNGQVYTFSETDPEPTLVIDIADILVIDGEAGLLGLAFHPQFASNGYVVLSYTTPGPGAFTSRIARRIRLGGNYGWSVMEGAHCFMDDSCDQTNLIAPVAEYANPDDASVVGGYVYRGAAMPELVGRYIYGDFYSGAIWAVAEGSEPVELLSGSGHAFGAFGEGNDGERSTPVRPPRACASCGRGPTPSRTATARVACSKTCSSCCCARCRASWSRRGTTASTRNSTWSCAINRPILFGPRKASISSSSARIGRPRSDPPNSIASSTSSSAGLAGLRSGCSSRPMALLRVLHRRWRPGGARTCWSCRSIARRSRHGSVRRIVIKRSSSCISARSRPRTADRRTHFKFASEAGHLPTVV